jgi:peptide chain release factor 3
MARRKKDLARDTEDKLVFMAESEWSLKMVQENHPKVQFHFTSEF